MLIVDPKKTTARVTFPNVEVYAEWAVGGVLRTGMRPSASNATAAAVEVEEWVVTGPAKLRILLNALTAKIATITNDGPSIGAEALFMRQVTYARTLQAD